MISEHMSAFAGKPVVDLLWEPPAQKSGGWWPWRRDEPVMAPAAPIGLQDPAGTIYRIAIDYEDSEAHRTWVDQFHRMLADPRAGELTGLVVGAWDFSDTDSSAVVEALVAAADRLPRVTALFVGDVVSEENEISWIVQSDVSPLFGAFPRLEHFGVRGGTNLRLGSPRHEHLRTLIVEAGGLDASVLHQVAQAELPALEHLELWLGDEQYGWNGTVADVGPLLAGDRFPRLRYLGLRDSVIADEVAAAVAASPVLSHLEVLDLSLGTLGDAGAAALLAAPAVRSLRKLDIHHHFCSPEMVERLKSLGIEVDASEPQKEETSNGDVWRFVAVGE
jgi:hypothetical protein